MDLSFNVEVASHELIEQVSVMHSNFMISDLDIIDVRDYGAVGDGVISDSVAFQKVLDLAQHKEELHIYVPEGVYRMTDTLHIYSNTTITLDAKAEIMRDHNGYLLMNGTPDLSSTSYNGHGNIVIEGRRWNQNGVNRPARASSFTFKHSTCKVITIKNCYFGNSNIPDTHPWPRAIGSHNSTIGRWYEDIVI